MSTTASTDATPEILASEVESDPRIRFERRAHRGIVAALDRAIALSSAPLMDADDDCHPERLAHQFALLGGNPEVGACATQVAYGGDADSNRGYASHVG